MSKLKAKENIPIIKVVGSANYGEGNIYFNLQMGKNKYIIGKKHSIGLMIPLKIWQVDSKTQMSNGYMSHKKNCVESLTFNSRIDKKNPYPTFHQVFVKIKDVDEPQMFERKVDFNWRETVTVLEGYIPKGAHYYEGDNGLMLSDKIVFTKVIEVEEEPVATKPIYPWTKLKDTDQTTRLDNETLKLQKIID